MRLGGSHFGRVALAAIAAILVASILTVGGGAATTQGFSCPSLAGATLFAGGTINETISGFSFFCTYSKDDHDGGQVAATWKEDPTGFAQCSRDEPFESESSGRIVSKTRAAYVNYRWTREPPGDIPKGAIVGLARQLLAAAEAKAAKCGTPPKKTTTIDLSQPTTSTVTETKPPPGCTAIDGQVTDRESKPIPSVHVRLEAAGATVDEEATGTDGRYHLAVPPDGQGALRVVVLAEEWAHTPSRFRVMFGNDVVGAAGPSIDPSSTVCTQDFAMAALGPGIAPLPSAGVDMPAAFDTYQALDAAWALATRLQPEPNRGLPLQVFVACEKSSPPAGVVCPKPPGIHFFQINGVSPYIAVDASISSIAPADMPNTFGHEFGHFFMWSAFGAIAAAPGNTNHGGYFANPSSADAWTEGFASFYSLMVRREVSREPEATVVGSWGDMEANGSAWQADGRYEEFAVIGILLDLVDGAGGAISGEERAVDGAVHLSANRDLFAAQMPAGTAIGTPWRVEILDSSGRRLRAIRGAVVEWEGSRIAFGRLPDIPFTDIRLVLRPSGRHQDDDPIKGDLYDLWPAILSFRSDNPASAGNHLFDVHDLYLAAQRLYGSDRDGNGNGVPDVDEVFFSHGFFGDTKGGVSNKTLDPGEIAGLSSHTEATLGPKTYPAMVPRNTPPVLPELQAHLDTGGVEATALVQVDFADPNGDASSAALVTPDAQGLVSLPVPPPGSGGTVSVIMLAAGHQPALALEVDPETFWPEADRHPGRSFLSASVIMKAGDVLLRGGEPVAASEAGETVAAPGDQDKGGFPIWLVVLLVSLALGGAAAGYWYVKRRRRAPGPPA